MLQHQQRSGGGGNNPALESGSSTLTTPTSPAHSGSPSSPSPTGSWSQRSTPLREPTAPTSTRPRDLAPSPIDRNTTTTPRKPIPSPLQQSSLNYAYTLPRTSSDGAIGSPRSPPQSPSYYHDGPRSPREKLDALLAEEDSHLTAQSPASPPPARSPPAIVQKGGSQTASPLSSYAQLRNFSAPVQLQGAVQSPPSPPAAMPLSARPSRPADSRPTAQRNHSIDSQVSSLSSTSQSYARANPNHQHKSSQDVAGPPDIPGLIASAGSPEAALMAMWKEKQSASNHNAQLWRLVEKQRSMIIGLNKDLERALKDKDRYRKKLKDYVNQVPPVPGAPKRSDTFDSAVERGETPSPAPSERQEEHTPPQTAVRAGEHKASPLTQATAAAQLVPESQLPQASLPAQGAPDATELRTAQSTPDSAVLPLHVSNKGLGLDALSPESVGTVAPIQTTLPEPARKDSNTSSSSAVEQLKAPALSLTQATPVLGGDGFDTPAKPSQPLRKAPPAPLNLSKPNKTSAHLHQAAPGEASDDEYDDTLEVEEIPIIERGRRKTREEDDRVREAMMMKDEEARSKSKKQKSESKSKPKATAEQNAPTEQIVEQTATQAGPASPRMISPTLGGLPLSPRHPPAHSLNALLSPTNSDSSMMANRSVGSIGSPLASPGLPTSPRQVPMGSPLPRAPRQGLASPPMSPRSNAALPQPRPPRQPIPLPPNTPQSYTSPQAAREQPAPSKQQTASADLLKPPGSQPSPELDGAQGDGSNNEHVYRGLVSDQYPGLLLPPNALPSIDVKVFSSRLRPSRLSFLAPKPQEEDPVFILAIYARSDGRQLWRLEKTIVALPYLDAQLKSLSTFNAQLPDRALFSGHAPARMDARRAALNQYFDTMLETPMNEKAALVVCEFFSTDVIGAQSDDNLAPEPTSNQSVSRTKTRQWKEGYLTKRGKNFGGWKARYFVLDGPEFRYYETAGGAHLGTIKLQNAQIGKQSQQQANQSPQRRDDSEDNQYRHAFLILEPKRKDSSSLVRHVLCAESDEERDAWVDALLQHVDYHEEPSPTESANSGRNAAAKQQSHGHEQSHSRRKDSPPEGQSPDKLQALSYEDTVPAQAPIQVGPSQRGGKEGHAGSPKSSTFSQDGHYPSISGPTNGAPIQDAGSWGNKSLAAPTSVKDKKRSIFGFRGRVSNDFAPQATQSQQMQQQNLRPSESRNIFGIPLQEAVEYSQPVGVNVQLPSVVYRCIEYLKAKKAYQEEGIFRLSGSNIVIKGLRDRFNNEGDVKLLSGDYYDVHAVASLLKLYLRELPSSILTRELHIDFLKVLGKLTSSLCTAQANTE